MMSTWPGLVSPSRFGSTSCSHLRVGTLSEKTTARAGLAGPTPISLSLATSAASLAESSSVICSASCLSVVSACLSGSSVAFFRRFSAVFARALCEERNALSSVYGNRRRSLRDSWGVVAEPGGGELVEDPLLSPGGRAADRLGRAAFAPLAADLVRHLGADLGAADIEVLDVLRLVLALVGDGGRVEHADQLGEGLRVAVVRGGAGQQQGVGVLGEPPRQLVAEAGFPDEVVRLVDDDRVPAACCRGGAGTRRP